MNEKEIAEVRKSLKIDQHAISTICGCYASATGEIIATFTETPGLMSEEEAEKYLSVFRKILSGASDRNLLEITFTNEQVMSGDEYQLLSVLKKSELKDTEAVNRFFKNVTQTLSMDENYVVLLTYNKYDVPYKSSDGRRVDDNSSEVYSYIMCSVCPVKMTKSALTYQAAEKSFHHSNGSSAVTAPELGFLFPAFDGRKTNIYNALFYSRSASDAHESFTDAVFRQAIRMTAAAQSETFRTVLAEALEEQCSFRVAKNIHEQLCARMEEHKTNREEEPLTVSKYQVKEVLESCGVEEERLEAFTKGYTESFGAGTDLNPKNIVNPKQFELRTPDVIIKVSPGRSDLVETKVIDGVKYILIRANEGVELNGLNVSIDRL